MKVKEFKGKPKVYVASHGGAIEVTTEEHMRNANRPLERARARRMKNLKYSQE